MSTEQRYTLDEAKLELARKECAAHGHSYEILTPMGQSEPRQIFCGRCGKSWNLVPRSEPS